MNKGYIFETLLATNGVTRVDFEVHILYYNLFYK